MRVLVTRPRPDAERTAAALAALGHQPIVVPLQEIRAVPVDRPQLPMDAVAVTSANALRHAEKALASGLAPLPCFCVGEETARAAREAGFGDIRIGPGEAEGLARLVAATLPSGARLAYLCGRRRRPALEARLASAGIAVMAVETYETVDRLPGLDELATGANADAAFVYSAGAARRLAEAFAGKLASARFVAISAVAAAAIPDAWRKRAAIAARPTEAAMIEALGPL